jgi:hypothetical protein
VDEADAEQEQMIEGNSTDQKGSHNASSAFQNRRNGERSLGPVARRMKMVLTKHEQEQLTSELPLPLSHNSNACGIEE